MSSDGETGESPSELLALLDSDNRLTVEQTKALIHENLYTSRDPTLLNALIEFYLETRSATALQILTNLHEGRAHQIFERLNEHLKYSQTRLDTLTLLGHIVRRQPSWLYKIVSTSLFDTLLKYLKSDTDVLILVSGLMIISTLLPLVPASVGGKLEDLFEIFVQLSSFSAFKPGNTPAVHLLHLNVAVYIFFHRLYAMYPNNLLDYLRSQYGGKNMSRSLIFQEVVKPMMEQVRLHPCLVTETANSETGKARWRAKEPHDIVIECQKLSLDRMDRVQEDGGFNMSWTSRQSLLDTTNVDKSASSTLMISGDAETQGVDLSRLKERRMSDSATQTGKSLQSGDSGVDSAGAVISADDLTPAWSPTVVCGLCTPPSSQMSPSASHLDLSKSLTLDQSQCSTPAMVQTPGESPTPSLAGDICSSVVPSRGRKILLSKNTVSGVEMHTETNKASSHQDTLQKDLYFALQKEIQASSAPAILSDHRTSTPKSQTAPVETMEVGCDVVEEATIPFNMEISENPNSDVTVDAVKDKERMTIVESTVEENGQVLTNENETVASELSDGNLPGSPLSSEGVLLELNDRLISRSSSSKTLQNMPHEADSLVDRTNTLTSESIDEESRETSSISVSQSGELVADSLTAAFVQHSETVVADCKYKTDQLESKSSEISLDDAYKSRSEAGVIPQSCTFLISSTWPWKSCCDSSTVDDGGHSSKAQCKPLPMDVLDTFIKLGSGIHLDEVARIPLVSQPGIDWTHYGGNPPVDEIDILRRQIQLLHQQLLYERHKCEQHALRNRRLISKTFKAVQYKEELQATKDQLRLQEEKMRELTEALNKESENNRKLKELTSSWDNQQQTQIRNLLNENAQLQYAKQEAEEKLKAQKKDVDELQLEFHQAKSSIFTLEGEVKKLKEQLAEKENLTLQVDEVSRELLKMGEINQQQKDVIKKLSVGESQNSEAAIQLQSVHKELSSVKQVVRRQKAELEALTTKLSDSEVVLSRKEMEVKELKRFTENVKGTYISKLKGLEDKYAAQKKVNQTLESHISLHTTLDNQHRKMKRTRQVATNPTESQEAQSLTVTKNPEAVEGR